LDSKTLNYTNIAFLTGMPLISIIGAYYWVKSGDFNINTVILAALMYMLVQLSITAGYHRLFSHVAYVANPIVKIFFLFFASAAFQGTALKWSQDHRRHHRFIDDLEKDPYCIGKGFWWAHLGWLFYEGKRDYNPKEVPDLIKDPLVMFQFKHYLKIGFFAGFILPMLVALTWHDAFGGLIIAGALRLTINHHSTFFINSLAHTLGKQNFSDAHTSRDNLITAILTFGEGYHNFHHEFPSDYRNGIHFYDFDPTKWLIYGLEKLGLVAKLRTADRDVIIRKQAMMMVKHFQNTCKLFSSTRVLFMIRMVSKVSGSIESNFSKLNQLKKEKNILNLSTRDQSLLSKKIKQAQEELSISCKLLGKIINKFEVQMKK